MQFPLSMSEISIWIAITAIILLITSELLFSYSGEIDFPIDKMHLRWASLILGAAFIGTVFLRFLAQ